MLKKWLIIIMALLMPLTALAEVLPVYPYTWGEGAQLVRSYDTDTLVYKVEKFKHLGTICFVTKVWMQDPGKQIKKATASWEKDLSKPEAMAKSIPGCALAINGSGYVTKMYPEIPDNYPGTSEDYYYTPLGSVTVTNGELFRCLDGVPFYGLTLQDDGLHLHVGDDPEDVLAAEPQQTWSFYEKCPLIRDHESILDREWAWANRKAIRTMIAKIDNNNYVLFTATNNHGMTLPNAVDFLMENFDPEWAYNLDGGPSSALLCRNQGKKTLKAIFGGQKSDVDVMGFVELTEE